MYETLLSQKWYEMIKRVQYREDIGFEELQAICKETYQVFAAAQTQETVSREACKLLLDVLEFERYVTLIDEASINEHSPGVFHMVNALKNGFLDRDFTSDFLELRVTEHGVEALELPADKKMYVLDMENGSLGDFVRFITSTIDDTYHGVKLVGCGIV